MGTLRIYKDVVGNNIPVSWLHNFLHDANRRENFQNNQRNRNCKTYFLLHNTNSSDYLWKMMTRVILKQSRILHLHSFSLGLLQQQKKLDSSLNKYHFTCRKGRNGSRFSLRLFQKSRQILAAPTTIFSFICRRKYVH